MVKIEMSRLLILKFIIMSSYLRISIRIHNNNIKLFDFTRSSKVYSVFSDVLVPIYAWQAKREDGDYVYNRKGEIVYEDERFTQVTEESLKKMLDVLNDSIKYGTEELDNYKNVGELVKTTNQQLALCSGNTTKLEGLVEQLIKDLHCADNESYKEEIIEDLDDCRWAIGIIQSLLCIMDEIKYNSSPIEGMYCNID